MEHNMLSQAQLKKQRKAELEENVRYVEALDGEGDYWLSVTDASRVCRVQDVSLRRAINRGELPVRHERAGRNKRTRFIRASDLPRAGYPIVDESAAITTEIGKADILSIPRQQLQIMADHTRLMSHYTEILTALEQFTAQFRQALHQQSEQFQQDLSVLQEELTRLLTASEERSTGVVEALRSDLVQSQQETAKNLQEQQGRMTHLQDDLRRQEVSHQTAVQALSTSMEHKIEDSREHARQSLETFAADQHQRLQTYQRGVDEAMLKTEQSTHDLFTALEQRIVWETAQLAQQFTTTTEQLEASIQSQQKTLTILDTRLASQQHHSHKVEETLTNQGARIAHVETLEQTVTSHAQQLVRLQELELTVIEQQQTLSRYEQLLSLTPQVEYLYRVLTEQGILPPGATEPGKNKQNH